MIDNATESEKPKIVITLPVYNDWESLQLLLESIDRVLIENKLEASILAIDDGSTNSFKKELVTERKYQAIRGFDVLRMGRNLGHQRAIIIALSYIEEEMPCRAIIVMDADGEDDPRYIPDLFSKFIHEKQEKIIFARREKRSESLGFKFFYGIYRHLYRLLTGSSIRVGNYCIIPKHALSSIVLVSETWNHFSAAILKSNIPYVEISAARSSRLKGKSHMSFVSLVLHGLSAMSVHSDTIGTRALITTIITMFISLAAMSIVISIKIFTNLAIPGWASTLTSLFFLIFMQTFSISLFFVFIVLNGRNNLSFLPKRDYKYFINSVIKIFPK